MRRHGIHLLSAAVFLAGFTWWFRVFDYVPDQRLLGDEGDGLFNLWALEHARLQLPRGFAALSDGRIFWPDNAQTFWWSDNLLVYQLLYAPLRALGFSLLNAYAGLVLLLSILAFVITVYFFQSLYTLCVPEEARRNDPRRFFIPLLAFLTFFSQIRMRETLHLQHHSGFLLLLMLIFALRAMREPAPGPLRGLAVCQLLLLFSAPYYAVVGLGLLLMFVLVQWLRQGEAPLTLLRRSPRFLIASIGLFILGVLPYLRVPSIRYSRSDLLIDSLSLPRLLLPLGGWPRSLISHTLPGTSGGYLGLFLLLPLLLTLAHLLRHPRILRRPPAPETCFLLLVLLWVYGLSFGPTFRDPLLGIDWGVWNLTRRFFPGVGAMRGLIRFAVVGQQLLAGLLFWLWLRQPRPPSRSSQALLAAWLLFSATELPPTRARIRELDGSLLTLTAEETEVFSPLRGSLMVLPATPLHRNTYPMIRWVSLPDLSLVNGYSGRVGETLQQIIHAQTEGPEAVLHLLTDHQVTYLVLLHARVPPSFLEAAAAHTEHLWTGDRYSLYRLAQSP